MLCCVVGGNDQSKVAATTNKRNPEFDPAKEKRLRLSEKLEVADIPTRDPESSEERGNCPLRWRDSEDRITPTIPLGKIKEPIQ